MASRSIYSPSELRELASFWNEPLLAEVASELEQLRQLVNDITNAVNPTTYGESIGGYQYMFNRIAGLLDEYNGN